MTWALLGQGWAWGGETTQSRMSSDPDQNRLLPFNENGSSDRASNLWVELTFHLDKPNSGRYQVLNGSWGIGQESLYGRQQLR